MIRLKIMVLAVFVAVGMLNVSPAQAQVGWHCTDQRTPAFSLTQGGWTMGWWHTTSSVLWKNCTRLGFVSISKPIQMDARWSSAKLGSPVDLMGVNFRYTFGAYCGYKAYTKVIALGGTLGGARSGRIVLQQSNWRQTRCKPYVRTIVESHVMLMIKPIKKVRYNSLFFTRPV